MGSKTRGYDESKSPQWKYLLQKESMERRQAKRKSEREIIKESLFADEEQRPRLTKKARRKRREEKRLNKQRMVIVYSATPDDRFTSRSPGRDGVEPQKKKNVESREISFKK